MIGAYQWWARGWPTAVEVAVDLVALVLPAAVVTATTRADTLLDALARPPGRCGTSACAPRRSR